MDATALFGHVRRRRDGMKMKGQEEDGQEQQQADQTVRLGQTGSGQMRIHNAFNMKFFALCQNLAAARLAGSRVVAMLSQLPVSEIYSNNLGHWFNTTFWRWCDTTDKLLLWTSVAIQKQKN
jgi:hypothetical protein